MKMTQLSFRGATKSRTRNPGARILLFTVRWIPGSHACPRAPGTTE